MAVQARADVSNSPNASFLDYIQAEKAALRLIARAEQCSAGLTRKLEKRGYDSASINKVISNLCEINLLDDKRFARLWLLSHMHLTRSPRRLLSSLCSRGIDLDDAKNTLKEVLDKETELALLERFAKKYTKKTDNKSEIKFLLKNEGFSTKIIEEFLQK